MARLDGRDMPAGARGEQLAQASRPEGRSPHKPDRLRSQTKTRKSAETRRRIMDAASKLMVERGNSAFQMSEISQICGMSKGALYYYFVDKDDLVNAVFDDVTDDLLAAVDEIVAQDITAEKTLHALAAEFTKRARQGSPLAMALVRELVRSREGTIPREQTRMHHLVQVVAHYVKIMQDEGIAREGIDTYMAAVAICGSFTFCAISANDADGVKADFESEILDLIRNGLR